jgi:hypothetical protein
MPVGSEPDAAWPESAAPPVEDEASGPAVGGQLRALTIVGIQGEAVGLVHHTSRSAQRSARCALVRAERRP